MKQYLRFLPLLLLIGFISFKRSAPSVVLTAQQDEGKVYTGDSENDDSTEDFESEQ